MANYQIKVQYGADRFSTFLLQDISYDGLLSSIRKNCSSLSCLEQDMIRLRYKDEDGDLVNIAKGDDFAFTEMLRTAQVVKDRDYKKVFIQANEIDSPLPSSRKRRLADVSQNSTPCCSRQLAYSAAQQNASTSNVASNQLSPLDSKQKELSEGLMILRIQITSAKEELAKLKEHDRNYLSLSAIRGRLCTVCHIAGHTKTTCTNEPCLDVNICKVRDKHPEEKAKMHELQSEIKQLEKQFAEEEANVKSLSNARERAKNSFFAVMRPRLRSQNLVKYGSGKRIQLDRDLLVLQKALNNKIPEWSEDEDWRLPQIIEQFQNTQLNALLPVHFNV